MHRIPIPHHLHLKYFPPLRAHADRYQRWLAAAQGLPVASVNRNRITMRFSAEPTAANAAQAT